MTQITPPFFGTLTMTQMQREKLYAAGVDPVLFKAASEELKQYARSAQSAKIAIAVLKNLNLTSSQITKIIESALFFRNACYRRTLDGRDVQLAIGNGLPATFSPEARNTLEREILRAITLFPHGGRSVEIQ